MSNRKSTLGNVVGAGSARRFGTLVAVVALIVAFVAIPYSVRGQRYANLPDATVTAPEALTTAVPAAERLFPLDPEAEAEFAFGYVEYDWNPRSPGGVPGFDPWIPSQQAKRPISHAEVP